MFHPGMKYVAAIRKELGWRTIFNLLGPLANPVDDAIEARVIGVARRDLGPVFAEALRLNGSKKALIICGEEDLDELSCAGRTFCWQLVNGKISHFTLSPADFGLPEHPLSEVSPGLSPENNAMILKKLLKNEMDPDDPILHFVLINTAALLVTAGVCDADTSLNNKGIKGEVIKERGPGGGRWKEGVRRARWAVESGAAWSSWEDFVEVTNSFSEP